MTAQQRLRVGIVGLQPNRSWAARSHFPALRALSESFEIVGIANSSLKSAEKAVEWVVYCEPGGESHGLRLGNSHHRGPRRAAPRPGATPRLDRYPSATADRLPDPEVPHPAGRRRQPSRSPVARRGSSRAPQCGIQSPKGPAGCTGKERAPRCRIRKAASGMSTPPPTSASSIARSGSPNCQSRI